MIEYEPKYIIEAFARGVNRFYVDPLYSDLEGWAKIKKFINNEQERLTLELASREASLQFICASHKKLAARAMLSLTNSQLSELIRASEHIEYFLKKESSEHLVTWSLL